MLFFSSISWRREEVLKYINIFILLHNSENMFPGRKKTTHNCFPKQQLMAGDFECKVFSSWAVLQASLILQSIILYMYQKLVNSFPDNLTSNLTQTAIYVFRGKLLPVGDFWLVKLQVFQKVFQKITICTSQLQNLWN